MTTHTPSALVGRLYASGVYGQLASVMAHAVEDYMHDLPDAELVPDSLRAEATGPSTTTLCFDYCRAGQRYTGRGTFTPEDVLWLNA